MLITVTALNSTGKDTVIEGDAMTVCTFNIYVSHKTTSIIGTGSDGSLDNTISAFVW